MATGLERVNASILRRINAPSSCKIGQVEQTPHETSLCKLSTYQNQFQVFKRKIQHQTSTLLSGSFEQILNSQEIQGHLVSGVDQ